MKLIMCYKIGYIRACAGVVTKEQQGLAMDRHGVDVTFEDWRQAVDTIRPGDALAVWSVAVIGKGKFFDTFKAVADKGGAGVYSISTDTLHQIEPDALGRITAAWGEIMEAESANARKQGAEHGGRPRLGIWAKAKEIAEAHANDTSIPELVRVYNVSTATIRRIIKETQI
jgi:hypothetical protein